MNEMIAKANELEKNVKSWTQFHQCQAYISDALEGNYRLIKSYNTIVGIADAGAGKIYEFGVYSRTTSKQFTRIKNEFFSSFEKIRLKETNWK